MTFKRFAQLFCFYLLSIVVGYGIITWLALTNFWLIVILLSIIGYIVLTLPLTILTLRKKQ